MCLVVSEEQLFYCRDLCRKKEGLENSVKKWLKIYLLIYYVQSFVDYVKNSRLGAFVISSFFLLRVVLVTHKQKTEIFLGKSYF